MRSTVLFALSAGALLLAGCTDSATLPRPSPRTAEGTPIRRDESLPPVQILKEKSHMQWEGRTAVGYARMDYFGNRAWQTLNINVTRNYSMVGQRTFTDPQAYILGNWRAMGSVLRYLAASTCGHHAVVYTEHGAAQAIPFTGGYVELMSVRSTSEASALQPACTGSGGGTCEEDLDYTQDSWVSPNPYTPCDGDTTGGGSGGADGQPVDETWVEEMFGIRFRCSRSADPNFEVVTCVAEEEEDQ
ncbi:MAG TPA: hypothetical protein VF665_12725 [Longimicrobium sp.]|jgi:hypothetical protein|uniref:hypothetical protein n=1 Tax=Longimicrobium sp. TaxID=2029185 RepID=UPI002ED86BBC